MSKTLVLFDFDGTLTKRDTFPQFIFFTQGYFKGFLGFLIFFPYIFLFLAKLMDGAKLKEKLVRYYFEGHKEEILYQKGIEFIKKLGMENSFKQDILKKLENYKEQNHIICIVSASLDIWIKPFCKKHSIDYLCTEIDFANGTCTGKLSTPNCNGIEKALRIKEKYNLSEYSSIIAYGNSSGDVAMFEIATEVVLVRN